MERGKTKSGIKDSLVYIFFGVIGSILVIIGAVITILSDQLNVAWALFGSGLAITWISFFEALKFTKKR